MYKSVLKRALDFLAASIGILILLPVLLIIAILLWIDFQSSPFYTQERPGKGEKIFKIFKFKTMNDKRDDEGKLLPDNQRITRIGRFIRKASLDEIPQLFNIIKGEMSLVGPRPLRTYYLPHYTKNERLRHTVRPGITGLAQVSGRNYLTWEERFDFDIYYVKNLSFILDIKILIKTLKKAFTGKDVAEDPDECMESFDVYRKRQIAQGEFPESINLEESN